jgi:hypothetical protein
MRLLRGIDQGHISSAASLIRWRRDMTKPLPKHDPVQIFLQADGFSAAYNLLSSVPRHEAVRIGHVQVVVSALAVELFLKCLICMETGRTSRGHYLRQLFDQLSPDTRRDIDAIWRNEVVPFRAAMWNGMERLGGGTVPRDLPTALSMANKSFEKVRYLYEGDLDGVAYILTDLPTILRRVIVHRRPEWRNIRRKLQGPSEATTTIPPEAATPGRG